MIVKIETKGLDELRRNLNKKSVEIDEAGKEGLNKVALKILAEAKDNIQNNNSKATGKLRNSGIVQAKNNDVDVIFKSIYASAVEFGRKGGKPPPYKEILQWVKIRGILDTFSIKTHRRTKRKANFEKRAIGIAIAIAKTIGKLGVKARPFLYPAFRQNEDEVMRILTNSIKKKL